MPWRLHDGKTENFEVFSPQQTALLASSHGIDQGLIRELARSIRRSLTENLSHLQTENFGVRINKGASEVGKAIRHIEAAQKQLLKVEEILSQIEFGALISTNNPLVTSSEEQSNHLAAVEALEGFKVQLDKMVAEQKVIFKGIPDKRRMRDLRRELICADIFRLWEQVGRKVSSTTNPLISEREGPLIAFVNDIVALVTEPSTRLSGETIHSDIARYRNRKSVGRSAKR